MPRAGRQSFLKEEHEIVLSRFPDLRSGLINRHAFKINKYIEFDLLVNDRDILLKAWAILLKAYTDEDELLFIVDNRVVKIRADTLNVERYQPEDASYSVDGSTGIFFEVTLIQPYSIKIIAQFCIGWQ